MRQNRLGDRRSFLIFLGSIASTVVACGATPTPTPLPRPAASPITEVLGPSAPPGQGPKFTVDQTEINFGNVKFDKIVSAVFKVTNAGTAPLVMKVPNTVRAESGC